MSGIEKYIEKGASISSDGKYRYRLWRRWEADPAWPLYGFIVHFIMLNPSEADGELDDQTVRKCVGFAKRISGCDGIEIINLFAYRAKTPKLLFSAEAAGEDIVGPENFAHIHYVARTARLIVRAWGNNVRRHEPHVAQVVGLLNQGEATQKYLGLTKEGHPKHPLMVPYFELS